MQFKVPDGADGWKVWKTVAADENGMVANPGVYAMEGHQFGGWYVEGDSVQIRYDFDLPYNDQPKTLVVNSVCAKMIPDDAPTRGDLRNGVWNDPVAKDKVVDAALNHDAWWEVVGDTLYLHCKRKGHKRPRPDNERGSDRRSMGRPQMADQKSGDGR
jgi:hypothetical protein